MANTITLRFLNEDIILKDTFEIKKYLLDFLKEWKLYFGDFKIPTQLNNAFTALSTIEKNIKIDDDPFDTKELVNKHLEKDRWPTVSVFKHRVSVQSEINAASYLFGAIYGRFYPATNELISISYNTLGVLDHDAFRVNLVDGNKIFSEITQNYNSISSKATEIELIANKSRKILDEHEKMVISSQNYIEDLNRNFAEKVEDSIIEFNSKIVNEIKVAKDTAATQLQLKEAQSYWAEKFSIHSGKEIKSFIFLILTGIFLIASMPFAIKFLINEIQSKSDKIVDPLTISISFLIAVSFWMMRTLNKIWISHSHLKNDAHEKMVMTKTFLSLYQKDGICFSDDQKSMFLNSIFKSAHDGMVKDNNLVTPMSELLNNFKKNNA